jgi:hypothetical protein
MLFEILKICYNLFSNAFFRFLQQVPSAAMSVGRI